MTQSCGWNLQRLQHSIASVKSLGFTFLVPAHLGSPGQRAVKWVCVCVCVVCVYVLKLFEHIVRVQVFLNQSTEQTPACTRRSK